MTQHNQKTDLIYAKTFILYPIDRFDFAVERQCTPCSTSIESEAT
ncbi:hypothetical protein T10_9738 [Trichinella papuae]|uniref:Uncharacterized protein n=1 Tax=Trichinella papuae TaxID=268474 RepID=A0A0V1MM69_9BILA|nr:hypothetical protein T10_9738 [Trichinella papuae]